MLALAAALLLIAPPPAPWEGAAFAAPAAEVARAAAALPPAVDPEVDMLLSEARFEADPQGRLRLVWHTVYRLLTPSAVTEHGMVQAEWRPWRERRPVLRARVVGPGGEEHRLDPATVAEVAPEGPPLQVGDARLLRAPLPGLVPGAVVELQTEFADGDAGPLAPGGSYFPLGRDAPTRLLRLRVEAPEGVPLHHRLEGLSGSPRTAREGGLVTLSWEWRDLPPVDAPEPEAPAGALPRRWFEVSTARSWREVAAAYSEVAEAQLRGEALGAQAREIAGGASGRDEAARRILAWMGERLRYTGLELGAAALIPARPSEVLARRYGDCKDLSLLLVGLMRALGHEADLVLLRAGGREAHPDVPALGAFNHAVVRLGGHEPAFVDPVFPDLAPGLLPLGLDGRTALLVRRDSQALLRLPLALPGDHVATIEREIRLKVSDRALVRETRVLGGYMGAATRRLRRGVPAEQLRESDRREILQRLAGGELASLEVEAPAGGPVLFRAEVRGSRLGEAQDHEAEARLEPRLLVCLPDPVARPAADAAARREPLEILQPCQATLRYRVVPPPGFEPGEPLPSPLEVEVGPIRYTGSARQEEGGAVVADFALVARRATLTAAQVTELRSALARAGGQDGPRVRFARVSTRLLDAGRGLEALRELRRVAAAAPRDAEPALRLANGLGRLGMGEAARDEARRAVALAPGEEWGHRVLASKLAEDPIGRWLAPGCDLVGAVAAQRRAVELEPERASSHSYLGWLLMHGDECALLGRGADPSAGADLLLEGWRRGARQHDDQLLRAVLQAGRAEKALELARGMKRGEERDGILLAALARTAGVAAAAREAAAWTPAERRSALFVAGRRLAGLRDYPTAAALLDAAGPGAEEPGRLARFARTLRGTRRIGPQEPPADSPLRPLADLFLAAARLAPADAPFSRSPPARRELAARMVTEAEHVLSDDMPPDVAAEYAFAQMEARFLGEPGGPGQLLFQSSAFDGRVFVVPEAGAWRILCGAGDLDQLAALSLHLRKGGQQAGAARALAWVREIGGGKDGGALLARFRAASAGDDELLAALIAPLANRDASAAPALEAALRSVVDPGRRLVIATSAAYAAAAAGDAEAELRLAEEVLRYDAGDPEGAAHRIHALGRLGRVDELRRVAAGLLADEGSPADLVRTAARAAMGAGAFGDSLALHGLLERRAQATPVDFNNAAWVRLFVDPGAPQGLADATRSAEGGRADYPTLHTLAAVLAAAGEPLQAMATLRKAVAANSRRLEPADFVVIGLVAEHYGERELALRAYRRVAPPARPDAASPHSLAQLRLGRLADAAGR